jgi:hypothetical protein
MHQTGCETNTILVRGPTDCIRKLLVYLRSVALGISRAGHPLASFFQAWMYLATIVLSLRGSRWGYFIGVSAAVFWDYINLFVTSFLRSGLHWVSAWMSTGHLERLDQIVAVPGWIGTSS